MKRTLSAFIFAALALPFSTYGLEYIRTYTGEPRPFEAPFLSNNDIRELMIIESNEKIHPCPCPYSADGMGGQCGNQALYYRPGGYRIWCYMKDITPEEVHFYRLRRGTPYILEDF